MQRFLLAACICCILLAIHPRPAGASLDPSLLKSLRQGGYILYVRHGEATVGEDLPNFDLGDCSTQKNLSEAGRRQAVTFGEDIRRLRIPVQTPVLASPFCRAKESAAQAFGSDKVQTDPFWLNIYKLSGSLPLAEQQATLKNLTSVLESLPSPGTNKVIVAHGFPQGVGLGEIPYMGTILIKPGGQGNGFQVVGRIALEDW